MNDETLLTHAASVIAERRQVYGDPAKLFQSIAARWSLILGKVVTPEQVVLCMADLKIARLSHDPGHEDSIIDLAGYAALLREVAR